MKGISLGFLIFLLAAICFPSFGILPGHNGDADRRLTADYVFVPGGAIGDSIVPEFYISSIEVTNRQYREFLTDLADSGATSLIRLAMVDTSRWLSMPFADTAMARHYYQSPKYNDYPVVNISHQAAEIYCRWLTNRYNSTARQKARFTLPTESQWMYAAMGGNSKASNPWPGTTLRYEKKGKWKGSLMANFRVDSATIKPSLINDSADILAPSRSFMPNTYEIYNMGGNAAEWIAHADFTKGGSFLSHAPKLLIAAHEDADTSSGHPNIGFRPVMILETR